MTEQLKNIMVVILQLGMHYINMETNQKITYGLIGILSLIVATLGGNVFLTEDQLDNAVICSVNQNIVIMDHLSSTSKTAYWYNELGEQQSKVCRGGLWLDLRQYAKDNDLDLNILLQEGLNEEITPSTVRSGSGGSYRCDSEKCVVIS